MSHLIKLHEKWENERDLKFLKMLDYDPDAKVIDLGCGKGDFTLKVQGKINAKEIYGVDVWEDALSEARSKGIKAEKMDLNEELGFSDGSFHVVVSNQVLEHLFFPSFFVQEIYRILKKDGYSVISTENLSSWDNIISLLLGYTPFSMEFDRLKIGNPLSPHDKKKRREYPPHVRIFSFQGLIDLFKFCGFKIETVSASGYLPFNFLANLDKRHSRFVIVKVRK
ncbi:MAG: class I SAM-dependent methyltransferase [Candidatus Hodarchaeota archaeon]